MTGFRFIEKPNLPNSAVSHVVVSSQYPQVLSALTDLRLRTLSVIECKDVLFPLRNHSDMLFSYLGSGKFAVENSQTVLSDEIKALGGFCSDDSVVLGSSYPDDVKLNFCLIGNNAIGLDCKYIESFLPNKTFLKVKQGYTKCSCVPVDENSLITDDCSVYSACRNVGLDVLLVSKGSVRLEGLDYGFVGGCCGKIDKGILAFCGDIRTHTDYVQINSFLRERNVYPLSLFGGDLLDIGSLIPVTEYK